MTTKNANHWMVANGKPSGMAAAAAEQPRRSGFDLRIVLAEADDEMKPGSQAARPRGERPNRPLAGTR